MGAFFLYNPQSFNEAKLNSVKDVYVQKGFHEPKQFHLGSYGLLLYQKQLVNYENFYEEDEGAIYVVGTVIYRGLGYSETLRAMLHDFCNHTLAYDELLGNYCAIIHCKGQIHILNDALNVCELFEDVDRTFVTSSFLAAAESMERLTIDRLTAQEKLLTGYIVGENTLFNEVKRVIPQTRTGNSAWEVHKWEPFQVPESDNNRTESVKERAETIKQFFAKIENIAREYPPELGLSGGYDSRMLFAGSQGSWPFKLDLHTHSTEGVKIHDVEKEIVKEMAKQTGTPLQIVPTHNMDYYQEEDVEDILKDGYYFFDGRCAYNMGAFSPVYTRKYKCQAVSGHGLTLNGLGGENYRNYYMNIKPLVSTKQWMKAKVYPCAVEDVLAKEDFNKLHRTIVEKMDRLLPIKWGKVVSNFDTRRYYSEMRMPDCDALNCNAHNQMEFYLTPFIDRSMIADAYRGREYVGVSGQYQADIIHELSPLVASFDSHYGYAFDKKEPFKRTIYMLVRGILPDFIWNARIRLLTRKTRNTNGNLKYFNRVREKSKFLDAAASYAESLFPEINFDNLRLDYAMMPNSTYISVVLYMLRDKINVGE